MQPVTKLFTPADRAGLARQHEGSGLDGIPRVMDIPEDAPADAEHHGPVSAYQRRERLLVAADDEALQQVSVAGFAGRVDAPETAKIAEHRARRSVLHRFPLTISSSTSSYCPKTGRRVHQILGAVDGFSELD